MLVVMTLVLILSVPSVEHKKQGHLILVGGGSIPEDVTDKFVELTEGGPIVVIPTASKTPEKVKCNFPRSTVLHTTDRRMCFRHEFYKPLEHASGVWLCGGDQVRLVSMYKNTPVEMQLKYLLRRGGVIGGTSAGASAVSKVMMYEGEEREGFGLIDNVIVDQHFTNRNRLPRLLSLLSKHPDQIGLGIDEGTAALIEEEKIVVLGVGKVNVCRGGQPPQSYSAGDEIQR